MPGSAVATILGAMYRHGLKITSAMATLLAGVLLCGTAAPAAIGQSTRCFTDWSDAGPIVAREGLLTTRDLNAWARKSIKGRLVRVTLCQDGERYVYRLLLKDRRGRISNRIVDARKPAK